MRTCAFICWVVAVVAAATGARPAAEIALIRQWIDQGARETPDGPPAPAPWEAPMELQRSDPPAVLWPGWSSPIDRVVASYLDARHVPEPRPVADAVFARRVYF